MEVLSAAHLPVSSVKDVPAEAFIKRFAEHLKNNGKFKLPAWADVVKTGPAKELAPFDPDWLFIRAAALIRHLYFRPDQGLTAFRKKFGVKQRRGAQPGHHKKAAGGCIRYCLQQFEHMGLLTAGERGGRRLTPKGQSEITIIARQLRSSPAPPQTNMEDEEA